MNIRIFTLGTRGDVQPFVALGIELQRRDHQVTLCTAENFQAFVEGYGVGFTPIRANFMEFTQSAEGKKMLGGNPLEIMKNMKKMIYPMMETMLEDLWSASEGAEALIYHPKAFGGYDVAERLEIPAFAAHPIPIIAPTGLVTNPALPFAVKNRWLNKKSYLVNRLALAAFQSMINRWRQETLGLGKRSVFANDLRLNGRDIPVLYGCSPSVVPQDPQWNGNVSMEGFWFLPESDRWEPPQDLADFLSAGDAPIAVSFSSMPLKDPGRIMKMLTEALRRVGRRGVIITGWSGMSEVRDESVYCIPEIPHTWLFPRVSGVIHHGGAGTTAAVLAAGKPMVVSPFTGDQPFWARRMLELGVAGNPLREKDMSADRFAERIAEITENKEMARKATQLAAQIGTEYGVRNTVDFMEKRLESFSSRNWK